MIENYDVKVAQNFHHLHQQLSANVTMTESFS